MAVEWSRLHTRAGRHSYHHIGRLGPSIVAFGQVVYNLIESAGNKISELHFYHGFLAFDGKTVTRSQDTALRDRGVSHPFFAKFLIKIIGDFKYTTIFCHILSHNDEVGVFLHALSEPVTDGIYQSFFGLGAGRCYLLKFNFSKHIPHFLFRVGCNFRFGKNFFQCCFYLCQKFFSYLLGIYCGNDALV